jgi:hypothetical protein
MKNIYQNLMMFSLLGTLMLSCSKDEEPLKNESQISAVVDNPNPNAVDFPNGFPPAEPASWSKPYLEEYYNDPAAPFTVIETVTPQYLSETCLFDISKLPNGTAYYQLRDSKLGMGFYFDNDDRIKVVKLKNVTAPDFGWAAKWGVSPFVEKENPEVLHANFAGELTIALSKPCIEFGFELAPNIQNKAFTYSVSFGNSHYDNSKGYVKQEISTPSGAKLYAVKATKSFNTVTITYNKNTGTDRLGNGFALANIRYKIAKK